MDAETLKKILEPEALNIEGAVAKLADELYGEDYLLRQLAEECAELAQAALKLVRAMCGETPVALEEAHGDLLEEIADVEVMLNLLVNTMPEDTVDAIDTMMDFKLERMLKRLARAKGKTRDECKSISNPHE